MFFLLFLYILSLLLISIFIGRKETSEDFLVSGRDRAWWIILASKFAGTVGVSWFITYAAYAYEFGWGVYIIILGFLFGYGLFSFWVIPKLHNIAKKKKFYTMGDFAFVQTGSEKIKGLVNYFSSLVQFLWLLVSVVGGANIFAHLGVISYEVSLLLIVLVLFAYVMIGGYKAVLVTDIFQVGIIFLFLVIILLPLFSSVNIADTLVVQNSTLSVGGFIGFLLYGTLSFFTLSDRYQLVYSAKTRKDASWGIFGAFLPILVIAFFIIFIGLFIFSQNPNLDPSLVFLELLQNYTPASLLSFGIVLLFAGLMSSADTHMYAIASHVNIGKQKGTIKNIRVNMCVLVIFLLFLGMFFRDIIDVTLIAAGFTLFLSFPMIYIISGGRNIARFFGSFIGAIVGFIIGVYMFGLVPEMVLFIVLGSGLGLLWKKKFSKRV